VQAAHFSASLASLWPRTHSRIGHLTRSAAGCLLGQRLQEELGCFAHQQRGLVGHRTKCRLRLHYTTNAGVRQDALSLRRRHAKSVGNATGGGVKLSTVLLLDRRRLLLLSCSIPNLELLPYYVRFHHNTARLSCAYRASWLLAAMARHRVHRIC